MTAALQSAHENAPSTVSKLPSSKPKLSFLCGTAIAKNRPPGPQSNDKQDGGPCCPGRAREQRKRQRWGASRERPWRFSRWRRGGEPARLSTVAGECQRHSRRCETP